MLAVKLIENSINPNLKIINRYIAYIEKCKIKKFSGRTERHHILPKSFGGKDENNIIRIPPRHHYIAHVLLAKATNSPKMIKALHKMIYSRTGDVVRNYKITSRMYEYLKNEHAKVVSNYSKGTVTAKNLLTNEIKRIPKHLFEEHKDSLYVGVNKGKKDKPETVELKRIAGRKPRKVKQGTRTRCVASSKYTYITPKGYCECSKDLLKLYPTFTKNTLTVIDDNFVISKKFSSIHPEFKKHIGKTLLQLGFKRNRK